MKISASVHNSGGVYEVVVQTNDTIRSVAIPSKPSGFGSSINGGELLLLALATCYCNDIYREAGRRGIKVTTVEVTADGTFGADGEPALEISYRANVQAEADNSGIRDLMIHTDRVAEIQNTLRAGVSVKLEGT